MKIIAVNRGTIFSPNHVGNDAAILKAVADGLAAKGHEVDIVHEGELTAELLAGYDAAASMARDDRSLDLLQAFADRGGVVVNSSKGVRNCVRYDMTSLLINNNVKHPESILVDLVADGLPSSIDLAFPCWVKRGDACAMVKEDVTYTTSESEALDVLASFAQRGITKAVISRHLAGDLVKFYGVAGTGFFYWFYPSPESHSKFGLEIYNGAASGYGFSVEEMRQECSRIASVLDVPVYGGDAIVLADGDFRIIDFNDWPSYARCREEAALSIAECINSYISEACGGQM